MCMYRGLWLSYDCQYCCHLISIVLFLSTAQVKKYPSPVQKEFPLALHHCMYHFNCSITNQRQTDRWITFRLQYWLDRQTCTFAVRFLFVFLFARFRVCDLCVVIYALWDFCVFLLAYLLAFWCQWSTQLHFNMSNENKTLKVRIYILKVLTVII